MYFVLQVSKIISRNEKKKSEQRRTRGNATQTREKNMSLIDKFAAFSATIASFSIAILWQ